MRYLSLGCAAQPSHLPVAIHATLGTLHIHPEDRLVGQEHWLHPVLYLSHMETMEEDHLEHPLPAAV